MSTGDTEPTPRIQVLESLVADQIAAGEVIERPASIVKELVENALDAGAREIEVRLVAGGRDGIVVRDDGTGMSAIDAERACLRHATSKLRRIEDLAGIASLGFRGEALASVAAVSSVQISTRIREQMQGTRVVLAQGAVRELIPAGVPPGTTIEVRDLFATLPARRKFLRSPQTELGHAVEWLQRIALARPEVGFVCLHGSRDVLRYPAVARHEERLRQVLGAERAREMLEVEHEEEGVRVRGWVSPPATHVAQARGIIAYVGGRYVRDRLLLRAISDAYRTLLPQGRYPVAIVLVDVPSGTVDVNVHPTKTEVRFAAPDAVYGATVRAVRAALATRTSVAGEDGVAAPACAVPRSAVAAVVGLGASSSGASEASTIGRVAEALSRYAVRADAGVSREPQRLAFDRSPASERTPSAGALPAQEARPRFSQLRILGQALSGYIVCEARDGLVLIDQHAAHERVRFERLRARSRGQAAGQRLLVPRVVELGEVPQACLLESREQLAAAGFDIEGFGAGAVVLRAIPAALDVSMDAESLLVRLGAELGELGASDRLPEAKDVLLARVACHGAVRVGDPLARAEMERLLIDLDEIPFAASCPHGRPVMIEIKRAEIERRVGRT